MWDEKTLARLRRRERWRERWRALAPHLPWIAVATLLAVLLTYRACGSEGPTATATATGCLPPDANGVVWCFAGEVTPRPVPR